MKEQLTKADQERIKRAEQVSMDMRRKHIISMINSIEKPGTLGYLDRFIDLFLGEWG